MRILHVGDDFAWLRPCGLTAYSDALMHGQAERGHEVSYVFSGRRYPLPVRPRVKRWSDRGVDMYELLGAPIRSHPERGTLEPELDLVEPAGEAAFVSAARRARPDLVHIHELARLPSSVIEHAKAMGLPVVMTLHDYKPVCSSVRLIDADGARCLRRDVGEDCRRNCASAPRNAAHLVETTARYELRRVTDRLRPLRRLDPGGLARATATVSRIVPWAGSTARAPSAAAYQRRRDINIARLSACDRLIAPSPRVAEIYSALGVDASRLCVQRLTLPHLERMVPTRAAAVGRPLHFVTLGGCASRAKGSAAITEAVARLQDAGRGDDYRLTVLGHVEPGAREHLGTVAAVSLHGPYETRQLPALLETADVGVLPSIWEETHGFVGIEMLAMGLPVIGSALGGIPEYVQPGVTGWLNRSATGAELARLMAAAIDDPSQVTDLRRSVRDRRRELVRPMDDHLSEVEALYAGVIESRRG